MSQKGRRKMSRRAQSTLEYTVLIGVMVAALVAMQAYLKRGMQGRLRGDAEQLTQGAAYSPGATNSTQIITRIVNETSNFATILLCRDNDGNEIDCEDTTIPIEKRSKISVSNSNVIIAQTTNQDENILSFADEPKRW